MAASLPTLAGPRKEPADVPEHRFLRPRAGMLAEVLELPLAALGPALVWLHDLQTYAHPALRDSLERLLAAGHIVVGAIRRAEFDALDAPGDLRNPAADALTDEHLVRRVDWPLRWSEPERSRLAQHASDPSLLKAVDRGMPVGVYCVAGHDLVRRLDGARQDEEHPYRFGLVRVVLDWYRTAVRAPVPIATAATLTTTVLELDAPEQEEIEDALRWATTPVLGDGRRTRQSLLTLSSPDRLLAVHDYLLDHDERINWQSRVARLPSTPAG